MKRRLYVEGYLGKREGVGEVVHLQVAHRHGGKSVGIGGVLLKSLLEIDDGCVEVHLTGVEGSHRAVDTVLMVGEFERPQHGRHRLAEVTLQVLHLRQHDIGVDESLVDSDGIFESVGCQFIECQVATGTSEAVPALLAVGVLVDKLLERVGSLFKTAQFIAHIIVVVDGVVVEGVRK